MTAPVIERIQIGNLSNLTTGPALHTLLAKYGTVVSYLRPLNPGTDLPGTIAYLEVVTDDVERAIAALDGMQLDGQEINVGRSEAAAAKKKAAKPAAATKKATRAVASKPAKAGWATRPAAKAATR